jgi:hypothetical protein
LPAQNYLQTNDFHINIQQIISEKKCLGTFYTPSTWVGALISSAPTQASLKIEDPPCKAPQHMYDHRLTIMQIFTFRKLKWIKNCICPSKVSSDEDLKFKNAQLNHLRTLDGQQMVYPRNEERELYFQQLNENWARN